MKPRLLTALLLSSALAACASFAPVAEGDGAEPPALALRGGFDVVTDRASPPPAPEPRRSSRRAAELGPIATLAAANSAARQRPTRDRFSAARQIYSYQPGALFELYANPNFVSTILLEPGESVSNIAAGDTSRWMVTEASAEEGTDPRTIVLVRPQSANLRTNIVIITDRRTYLVEAIAQAGSTYAAQVAWSYPQSANPSAGALSLNRLNFSYRIHTVRGRTPAWSPSRVFDDGRRTWIEFGPEVSASDLPPVFIVTGEGAELVNYRVAAFQGGQRYVIDRVFDRAELRLGVHRPIIVRIDRQNPAGGRS